MKILQPLKKFHLPNPLQKFEISDPLRKSRERGGGVDIKWNGPLLTSTFFTLVMMYIREPPLLKFWQYTPG